MKGSNDAAGKLILVKLYHFLYPGGKRAPMPLKGVCNKQFHQPKLNGDHGMVRNVIISQGGILVPGDTHGIGGGNEYPAEAIILQSNDFYG
jgi:hypothetical protein